jgi:FkbM family methyltransferase
MTPAWLKPEYIYRPRQALRRLARVFAAAPTSEFVDARFPWGMPIRVRPDEVQGKGMLDLGLTDLPVVEVLWRLTDEGETVADVGANIGAMSAVLAKRVGKNGRVFAFEAHPVIFQELEWNIALWKEARIHAVNVALSRERGVVFLDVPRDFTTNRGLCSVSDEGGEGVLRVPAQPLDDFFASEAPALMKIDVEGHELAVLEGAARTLAGLRDIVFEEHRPFPTPVTELLAARGFEIFRIARALRGVRLLPGDASAPRSEWEPTNFLATRDRARAFARLRPSGWRSLARE